MNVNGFRARMTEGEVGGESDRAKQYKTCG